VLRDKLGEFGHFEDKTLFGNESNLHTKRALTHNITVQYGLAATFYQFTHLINPASSDGRTMDKILEQEILFLNILWSFCEDKLTRIVTVIK